MNGSRYREIQSPAKADGVGAALRRAFVTDDSADDFLGLLQELDRKTLM